MEYITNLLGGGGWEIIVMILALILPNKWFYMLGYGTVGNAILLITTKSKDKPVGKIIAYGLNCVAEFLEGIVDRIRGENKYAKDEKKRPVNAIP